MTMISGAELWDSLTLLRSLREKFAPNGEAVLLEATAPGVSGRPAT